MPTYDYRCTNGHEFEEFQSMVAPPLDVCPVCGAPAERMISGGSGLIFKGSGFYITDYVKKTGKDGSASSPAVTGSASSSASASSSSSSSPDASSSSSSGASSSSGTDSKP
ncbi:MAG: zinc ribbon domain-containing protein [bacterium]|nr:zinc ribbon domain-containing protein [bacterium]